MNATIVLVQYIQCSCVHDTWPFYVYPARPQLSTFPFHEREVGPCCTTTLLYHSQAFLPRQAVQLACGLAWFGMAREQLNARASAAGPCLSLLYYYYTTRSTGELARFVRTTRSRSFFLHVGECSSTNSTTTGAAIRNIRVCVPSCKWRRAKLDRKGVCVGR